MDTTKEGEDLSAAHAVIGKFIPHFGAAHAPPFSPPASSSSGSSGIGSGSSGANGSGGSPPGDSTGSHNHDDGDQMDDVRSKKTLLRIMIGALIFLSCVSVTLTFFAAKSALFMSTPEGVAQTDRMLAYSKEMDARRHEEEMKDKEIALARLLRRTSPVTELKPTTAVCIPLSGTGSYRAPIPIGAHTCIAREHTTQDVWISFAATPKNVSGGEVWFNELAPNGQGGFDFRDLCRSDRSPDHCVSWLSSKLGTPLSVVHKGRLEISTS